MNLAIIRNYGNIINKVYRSFSIQSKIIPEVTYEQVKDITKNKKNLIIDVREPIELVETGAIPNSLNIPLGEVKESFELSERRFTEKFKRQYPRKDDEIVFSCLIGKRSLAAAEIVSTLGFTNTKNYKGSWQDWVEREGIVLQKK